MTDLGTFNGSSTGATAINNAGQVIGYYDGRVGQDRAFLWEDGVMTDLGALYDGSNQARDINETGQVVGNSATANGFNHATYGKTAP